MFEKLIIGPIEDEALHGKVVAKLKDGGHDVVYNVDDWKVVSPGPVALFSHQKVGWSDWVWSKEQSLTKGDYKGWERITPDEFLEEEPTKELQFEIGDWVKVSSESSWHGGETGQIVKMYPHSDIPYRIGVEGVDYWVRTEYLSAVSEYPKASKETSAQTNSKKLNNLTQNTMNDCCKDESSICKKLISKIRGIKKNVRLRREYGIENNDGSPTKNGKDLVVEILYKERLGEIDAHIKELESKKKTL